MSRFGPISPVTPDVSQQIAAGGQQANVRNQQALQARQIQQQGQIANQQAQLQQEQMDQQRQIAFGNQATQMAGVYEQARSQAEYRDFLREKAAIEQGLTREKIAADQQAHQEEMALRQKTADRAYNLQLGEIKARYGALSAELGAEGIYQAEMAAIQRESDDLNRRLFEANVEGKKGSRAVEAARSDAIRKIDDMTTAAQMLVDDTNIALSASFSDANFLADFEKVAQRDKDWTESTTERMTNLGVGIRDLLAPNIFEGEKMTGEERLVLQYIGEDDGALFGGPGVAVRPPGDLLRGHVARSVADSLGGLNEQQRGAVHDALDAALRAASAGRSPEGMLQLRTAFQKQLTEAGVGNTLVVDEALNAAAKLVRRKVMDYAALPMPDNVGDLESYEATVDVNGTPVRAVQAYINSKVFTKENADGLFQLAATGSSIDRLRSLRDTISPESQLLPETLRDTLMRSQNQRMLGELDDPLLSALESLIAQQSGIAELEREQQRFDIAETGRVGAASQERRLAGLRSELQGLEALLSGLED